VGQILQFFAVKYADVSTVAILGSFEVFITGALVVLVFKTESIPIRPFLFAATTACLGAVIILL
jgi:drug/metabolite transporter (DMT)-like permease